MMAPPFLCLGALMILLFSTLALAQAPPAVLNEAELDARNFELRRIQCDEDPVPFHVSVKYFKTTKIAGLSGRLETYSWEPQDVTAQKLCALPEYGGYASLNDQGIDADQDLSLSLRAFCLQILNEQNEILKASRGVWLINEDTGPYPNSGAETAGVGFLLDYRQGQRELHTYNDRARLYCRNHCFCNRAWDAERNTVMELTNRPKGYSSFDRVFKGPHLLGSREIDIDHRQIDSVPDDSITAFVKRYTYLYDMYDVGDADFLYDDRAIHLTGRNHIECSVGPIPEIALPAPYTTEDFGDSVQAMCAVALSGGNPGANAGGYCYHPSSSNARSRLEASRQSEVWFADDMIPRPEWRLANNFRQVLQLRYLCHQSCWCADDSFKLVPRRKMSKFWKLMGGLALIELGSGALQLKKYDTGPDGPSFIVTPAQWKSQSLSQRPCIVEGVDYCKAEPWPVDILGPPPPADPSTADGLYPADTIINPSFSLPFESAMCGQSCDGPASQTCSGGQASNCKCAFSNSQLAQLSGVDPVAGPVFLCINIAVAGAMLAQQRKPTGFWNRLIGRGLEQTPVLDLSCPCNSTYVSRACCESDSGLLCEARELKLGELGPNGELWRL